MQEEGLLLLGRRALVPSSKYGVENKWILDFRIIMDGEGRCLSYIS